MPLDKVEILKVACLVAPVSAKQTVAKPQPGRLAATGHKRRPGAVHARDHEGRSKPRLSWSIHGAIAHPTVRRPGGRESVLEQA